MNGSSEREAISRRYADSETKVVSEIKDAKTIRRKGDKFVSGKIAISRHSERLAKESSLLQYKASAKNENNSPETDHASMPLGIFASKNLAASLPSRLAAKRVAFTLAEGATHVAHCDKYRRVAFTLAEVLITLGIIGVVAALTIPSLIAKYQDKVLIQQTKKAFSVFQNGLALASQDNGTPGDNSLTFPKDESSYFAVVKNFSKYFKGSQVCLNSSQKGCSQFFYQCAQAMPTYNNAGETVYNNGFAYYPKIVLADGTIFGVSSNRKGCENTRYTGFSTNAAGEIKYNADGTPQTYDYYSAICANIIMDVNGVKGPNQYGRDVYHLWVFKNDVKPANGTDLGGTSLNNILSGKEELVYTKYKKGQKK